MRFLPRSVTNEVKKVGDLFRLDIFPCRFQDWLFQAGTPLLDSTTAGISNENHNVAKNAPRPQFNEPCRSGLAFTQACGEMGILAEWEKQLNGGKQAV